MGRARIVLALVMAGCGFGGSASNPDGGVDGSVVPVTCGDGIVQPELGELCDPRASGDEQCPRTCEGANVCSRGVLVGSDCTAQCTQMVITEAMAGDGCCPAGENSTTDADCVGVCGNGILEGGEVCDGNCPTSCDDGVACTANVLNGTECSRACDYPAITAAMNGDACCPGGANANIDNDCNPVCGNTVVETGETCDDNCPTSCSDSIACTSDDLVGADCTRECRFTQITIARDNDGCCPATANALSDNDCMSMCGNGVTEPGETCDAMCPVTCVDGNACTRDIVDNPGTCQAACRFIPITERIDNDGCCPPGTPPGQDSDCL